MIFWTGVFFAVIVGIWLLNRFILLPRMIDSLAKEGRKHYPLIHS